MASVRIAADRIISNAIQTLRENIMENPGDLLLDSKWSEKLSWQCRLQTSKPQCWMYHSREFETAHPELCVLKLHRTEAMTTLLQKGRYFLTGDATASFVNLTSSVIIGRRVSLLIWIIGRIHEATSTGSSDSQSDSDGLGRKHGTNHQGDSHRSSTKCSSPVPSGTVYHGLRL